MNLLSKIATSALAVILVGVLVFTGVQGSSAKKSQAVEESPIATVAEEVSEETASTQESTTKSTKKSNSTSATTTKAANATTATSTTSETESTTEETFEPTGYSIHVNIPWNCITIYYQNEPITAMRCSVGVGGENSTPEGTFYITRKSRWGEMNGPCWAQYLTDVTGSYWFHSVPCSEPYDPSSLWYNDYNVLGSPASHGCIRLCVADAAYIYYNIPYGSEVVCYYDYSSPGPLGKPGGYTIPTELVGIRGWDPTDPDSDNPWHTYDVSITGPSTITVDPGSSLDTVKEKITAMDTTGNSVRDFCSFTFSDENLLKTPGASGTLTVTFDYSAYSLCCRSATFKINVTGEPEPTTEEPTTEEPTTEEPSTEEPSTEEPTTEEPTTNEPSTEESTTNEPLTEGPASE